MDKPLLFLSMAFFLLLISCSTFQSIESGFVSAYPTNSVSFSAPNRLDFTTEFSSPGITVEVMGNAIVTWHYSDGSTEIGNYPGSNFGSSAHRAHYVTIDPPESLYSITANSSNSGISSLEGLGNFPNLTFLDCVLNYTLTNIGFAGCHSLRQLALSGTGASKEEVDEWIMDLNQSLPDECRVYSFMNYPPRTHASDEAYSNLLSNGWDISDGGY